MSIYDEKGIVEYTGNNKTPTEKQLDIYKGCVKDLQERIAELEKEVVAQCSLKVHAMTQRHELRQENKKLRDALNSLEAAIHGKVGE